jgi:hypothetical protein
LAAPAKARDQGGRLPSGPSSINSRTELLGHKQDPASGRKPWEQALSDIPLAERLRGLAAFLPGFESPSFEFGTWSESSTSADGVITLPYFTLGETASAFVRRAYDLGWVQMGFDWPAWKETTEAQGLRDDPVALSRATPDQLAHLLTVVIRQDRFVEGALDSAYHSGLLTAIMRRAKALVAAGEAVEQ